MTIAKNYEEMPDDEWLNYGVMEWAYVKSGTHTQGHTIYNVFKADGTFVTMFDDYKLAFVEISQHGIEPLWVH